MSNRSKHPVEYFVSTAILLLSISIIGSILFHWNDEIKKILLGFWIIVPPFWLWFEFCFLYERKKTPFSEDFEKFKYGQELSKNLWLSISAILIILYFGQVPGL